MVFLIFGVFSAFAEIPTAANWISNPSFEEGESGDPVDWVFFKQHEKTVGTTSPEHARSGSSGAGIKGEGGLSYGRWITPYRIPLDPGVKYQVSFWYRGKGASVSVTGQAMQMTSSGNLMMNLNKTYKIELASPPPAEDWTFVEASFQAPGYPSWAQLELSGGKRDACSFDDISLARAGLTVVGQAAPLIVPVGSEFRVDVFSHDLIKSNPSAVQWKVASPFELVSANKDAESGIWSLSIRAKEAGTWDFHVEAAGAGKPMKLTKSRFVRAYLPGVEKLFTFAAVTDTHFYRPGENERNAKFAVVADSLNALDPLFTLSLGDQMEISSGSRDEEKKWIAQGVKEQFDLLRMPVFMLAGNHEIDRTYEGAGTRWYFEKYLAMPRYWSFQVGDTLFAGVDVSTPGVATREHGASFLDQGQAAWFKQVLAAPLKTPAIVAGHISPFAEWSNTPDRDLFLASLLQGHVGIYLCGHQHYTDDRSVTNGVSAPPWPKAEPLKSFRDAQDAIDDPRRTVVLTTTTACAFELGDKKSSGYRYALVRDGKVVWQSVLPSQLRISREVSATGSTLFTLKNGQSHAVERLPLIVHSKVSGMVAKIDGIAAPVETMPLSESLFANLIQVDLPINAECRVEFILPKP
jgi:hypothetical protein